ncbi:MAG: NAD-dependent epimerase/dehydratase family protein [Bacteroidetes bacterium]|nr:MAG: NAD-dependent epimerase/dehydratase family protein [Bacteroidota bacterium]
MINIYIFAWMKIAVTGANGHVGSNLCKTLLDQGFHVKALAHRNTGAIQDLPLELIQGDLLDRDSIRNLLHGADFCFHLAACISIKGDPDGMVWKINAEGTRNMVEIARESNLQRFIHFSSIHAFQQHPREEPLDETRALVTHTGFAYDRSKAEGERAVLQAISDGLDALILSPTAIIGPGDPEPSLTGKALLELYHRQIPMLVPGGYNWVDVRDVVNGAINAMTLGRTGEKYLLSGTWHSLWELASLICRVTGSGTPQRVVPMWLARVGLPFITLYSQFTGGEPLYTSESLQIISEGNHCISNEKARRELNFAPRELEETVRDAFAWFKEKGYIH